MKICTVCQELEANLEDIRLYCSEFIGKLESLCGFEIAEGSLEEIRKQGITPVLVASGGSERNFLKCCEKLSGPFVLITIPAFNSLAASLEIKGFLDARGEKVEILHGSVEYIADRLKTIMEAEEAIQRMKGLRLGSIGDPTGLIASMADRDTLLKSSGMEIVRIELAELVSEYHKGGYPMNPLVEDLLAHSFDRAEMEKALDVYGALKRLVDKYNLDGLALKCFDLLDLIGTTGCLGLAILNAEGIPASCEGDTMALISIMIVKLVTGRSCFMANPSSMDFDEGTMVLAHCTIPLVMTSSYDLTTHFESGIGVAVDSVVEPGAVTIFKCDDTLKRVFIERAELIASLHEAHLCRSQMKLKPERGPKYLLDNAVCNHQCIVLGDWSREFREFFSLLGV